MLLLDRMQDDALLGLTARGFGRRRDPYTKRDGTEEECPYLLTVGLPHGASLPATSPFMERMRSIGRCYSTELANPPRVISTRTLSPICLSPCSFRVSLVTRTRTCFSLISSPR